MKRTIGRNFRSRGLRSNASLGKSEKVKDARMRRGVPARKNPSPRRGVFMEKKGAKRERQKGGHGGEVHSQRWGGNGSFESAATASRNMEEKKTEVKR